MELVRLLVPTVLLHFHAGCNPATGTDASLNGSYTCTTLPRHVQITIIPRASQPVMYRSRFDCFAIELQATTNTCQARAGYALVEHLSLLSDCRLLSHDTFTPQVATLHFPKP